MKRNSKSDRAYLVDDSHLLSLNDVFTLYESGKGRRYALLFAVNGGGFAIATWLLKDEAGLVKDASHYWPLLRPLEIGIAVGLIVFTAIMCMDIYAFGKKMRDLGDELVLVRL